MTKEEQEFWIERWQVWRADWRIFAREVLGAGLDPEQEEIVTAVQYNKMTSVASGTGRGKDYTAAVIALCFMYLTPEWNSVGELIANTKIALSAPTDRQIENVMVPEYTRLYNRALKKGVKLPGRLVGYDIRTDSKEWFLTGFAADPHKPESWAGFHAVNTMFIITEASGVSDTVFKALEGNLQGNSRILIVFNPNHTTGYAAESQKSDRWKKFRLNSMNAPNVLNRNHDIPGQVDYDWVEDKVKTWCKTIDPSEYDVSEGDFQWQDGQWYRPDDEFRKKVLGMFPKVDTDVLVPVQWIEIANKRWKEMQSGQVTTPMGITGTPRFVAMKTKSLRLGIDVAGMGRDNSVFVQRFGDYVDKIISRNAKGTAAHMEVVGVAVAIMKEHTSSFDGRLAQAFWDTIGEGAGCYSRMVELSNERGTEWLKNRAFSAKFSEAAEWNGTRLTDVTKQNEFINMRAYLYWAIRDWLNPAYNKNAALPENESLLRDLSETLWKRNSRGHIQIEAKEDIKKRLGRSPDVGDALAETFWPAADVDPNPVKRKNIAGMFQR